LLHLQVQDSALLQQGVPGGSMATAQADMQGTAAPAAGYIQLKAGQNRAINMPVAWHPNVGSTVNS
jgi:hypothetical protein